MDARAFTEGFRALVLWTAGQIDFSRANEELVSLLTPVIKAYGTDRGFETAVAMQQVFGGHGYVAEWGMEQIVRDARVAMLYEGANGVQALDLVGRKLVRDGGAGVRAPSSRWIASRVRTAPGPSCPSWSAPRCTRPCGEAREAALWLLSAGKADARTSSARAPTPILELVGVVAVGLDVAATGERRVARCRRSVLRRQAGDRAALCGAEPAAGV